MANSTGVLQPEGEDSSLKYHVVKHNMLSIILNYFGLDGE